MVGSNIVNEDHVGIIFPYSLLRTRKFRDFGFVAEGLN